jgi:hypothetical protein
MNCILSYFVSPNLNYLFPKEFNNFSSQFQQTLILVKSIFNNEKNDGKKQCL